MEEWREVKGYEGLYEVSNYGNVRSVDRILAVPYKDKNKRKRKFKGKQLSPNMKDRYLCVHLQKDGKGKAVRIHRLVAETFVDNPNNYNVVNHKDENKHNNRADNLEWCTVEYNVRYGTRTERASKTKTANPRNKTVYQYSLCGELIGKYTNLRVASEETGINQSSIGHGLYHNKNNKSKGYIWKFEPKPKDFFCKVCQF